MYHASIECDSRFVTAWNGEPYHHPPYVDFKAIAQMFVDTPNSCQALKLQMHHICNGAPISLFAV